MSILRGAASGLRAILAAVACVRCRAGGGGQPVVTGGRSGLGERERARRGRGRPAARLIWRRRGRLCKNRPMGKPALDLAKLTAEEKFDLIDELWESLGDDALALPPEVDAEMDRRLDRLDRDGLTGSISWEDVRAEMTRKS